MTLAPVQNPGQFKVYSGGLAWKRQGGGKTIEIDKADVTAVTWMKVPRAYQLGVRIKDGLFYRFIGFREQVPPPSPRVPLILCSLLMVLVLEIKRLLHLEKCVFRTLESGCISQ
jgi:structure-specific recognition protein 1